MSQWGVVPFSLFWRLLFLLQLFFAWNSHKGEAWGKTGPDSTILCSLFYTLKNSSLNQMNPGKPTIFLKIILEYWSVLKLGNQKFLEFFLKISHIGKNVIWRVFWKYLPKQEFFHRKSKESQPVACYYHPFFQYTKNPTPFYRNKLLDYATTYNL